MSAQTTCFVDLCGTESSDLICYLVVFTARFIIPLGSVAKLGFLLEDFLSEFLTNGKTDKFLLRGQVEESKL